jgi:hypothetical protein
MNQTALKRMNHIALNTSNVLLLLKGEKTKQQKIQNQTKAQKTKKQTLFIPELPHLQ